MAVQRRRTEQIGSFWTGREAVFVEKTLNIRVIFWKIVCIGSGRVSHHRWSFFMRSPKIQKFLRYLANWLIAVRFSEKKIFLGKKSGYLTLGAPCNQGSRPNFFLSRYTCLAGQAVQEYRDQNWIAPLSRSPESQKQNEVWQFSVTYSIDPQAPASWPSPNLMMSFEWALRPLSKNRVPMKFDIGLLSNCQKSKFYFQFS